MEAEPAARVRSIELLRLRLPFVVPFRSAVAEERVRDALLVHVETDTADGWGECAAPSRPNYTSEYAAGAHAVLRDYLVPLILTGDRVGVRSVAARVSSIKGHAMAKAALEMALLDAHLRETGESLARFLGGVRSRVECGVAIGIADRLNDLLDEVERRRVEGYRRIKLKVAPGWDTEPVAAVRSVFGHDLPLSVDANGAYTREDLGVLRELDERGLTMIEEPLGGGSLTAHAQLSRELRTPVCLDESIGSVEVAQDALRLGACSVVNIKPARVGGLIDAVKLHDVCAGFGVAAWCGGMFETGIGRAANLAFASLPDMSLPADMSPAGRHYHTELSEPPAVMRDGHIAVPQGAGLGVDVVRRDVDSLTLTREVIRR